MARSESSDEDSENERAYQENGRERQWSDSSSEGERRQAHMSTVGKLPSFKINNKRTNTICSPKNMGTPIPSDFSFKVTRPTIFEAPKLSVSGEVQDRTVNASPSMCNNVTIVAAEPIIAVTEVQSCESECSNLSAKASQLLRKEKVAAANATLGFGAQDDTIHYSSSRVYFDLDDPVNQHFEVSGKIYNPERETNTSMNRDTAVRYNDTNLETFEALMGYDLTPEVERAKFHPNSHFKLIWDMATFFLLIANTIYIPVYLMIMDVKEQQERRTFMMVSDLWFIIDIWINFNTGYVTNRESESLIETTDVCMAKTQSRNQYFKTWFAIDLVSSVPFDLILQVYDSSSASLGTTRFVLRNLKLLKLTRTAKLYNAISHVQCLLRLNFHYDKITSIVTMIELCIEVILICTLSGCMQYGVCFLYDDDQFKKSWIRLQNLHINRDSANHNLGPWERYCHAFFRAFSQMFCIGYGQIAPRCLNDAIYLSLAMFIGATFFATFIAKVTAILQNSEICKQEFKAQIMQLKEYTNFRKFPREMRDRLTEYFEIRYDKRLFNEQKIMSELNPLLRRRLMAHKGKALVESIEYLNQAEEEFIFALVVKLRLEVYLQGDMIVKQGDKSDCMFFIRMGTVTVSIDNTKIEFKLKDGCFFGESSLIAGGPSLRQSTVHADSNIHLFRLTVDDFQEVLSEYPRTQANINEWTSFMQKLRDDSVRNKSVAQRQSRRDSMIQPFCLGNNRRGTIGI